VFLKKDKKNLLERVGFCSLLRIISAVAYHEQHASSPVTHIAHVLRCSPNSHGALRQFHLQNFRLKQKRVCQISVNPNHRKTDTTIQKKDSRKQQPFNLNESEL